MNTSHIPGPYDAEMLLEDAAGVTKTATYDGAEKDLGDGYAPGGVGQPIAAVIQATALDLTTEDETYSLQLEESADGDTWTACGLAVSVTATGAVSVPGFVSERYVRVKATLAGTSPSITYKAHLVPLGLSG